MRKQITLNETQIDQVEALAAYLPIYRIAGYFGFSETTFHEIKKRQPEVSEAYNRGVAKACSYVGSTLMSFIREKENTPTKLNATMFYLRTKGGWGSENKNNNEATCLKFTGEQKAAEILNIGFNALKEGQIDFAQMRQIGDLALTKLNIENNGSMEDRMEYQQRSRQEALEFASIMKEARDNLKVVNASKKEGKKN